MSPSHSDKKTKWFPPDPDLIPLPTDPTQRAIAQASKFLGDFALEQVEKGFVDPDKVGVESTSVRVPFPKYTVKPGDTWFTISMALYGNTNFAAALMGMNMGFEAGGWVITPGNKIKYILDPKNFGVGGAPPPNLFVNRFTGTDTPLIPTTPEDKGGPQSEGRVSTPLLDGNLTAAEVLGMLVEEYADIMAPDGFYGDLPFPLYDMPEELGNRLLNPELVKALNLWLQNYNTPLIGYGPEEYIGVPTPLGTFTSPSGIDPGTTLRQGIDPTGPTGSFVGAGGTTFQQGADTQYPEQAPGPQKATFAPSPDILFPGAVPLRLLGPYLPRPELGYGYYPLAENVPPSGDTLFLQGAYGQPSILLPTNGLAWNPYNFTWQTTYPGLGEGIWTFPDNEFLTRLQGMSGGRQTADGLGILFEYIAAVAGGTFEGARFIADKAIGAGIRLNNIIGNTIEGIVTLPQVLSAGNFEVTPQMLAALDPKYAGVEGLEPFAGGPSNIISFWYDYTIAWTDDRPMAVINPATGQLGYWVMGLTGETYPTSPGQVSQQTGQWPQTQQSIENQITQTGGKNFVVASPGDEWTFVPFDQAEQYIGPKFEDTPLGSEEQLKLNPFYTQAQREFDLDRLVRNPLTGKIDWKLLFGGTDFFNTTYADLAGLSRFSTSLVADPTKIDLLIQGLESGVSISVLAQGLDDFWIGLVSDILFDPLTYIFVLPKAGQRIAIALFDMATPGLYLGRQVIMRTVPVIKQGLIKVALREPGNARKWMMAQTARSHHIQFVQRARDVFNDIAIKFNPDLGTPIEYFQKMLLNSDSVVGQMSARLRAQFAEVLEVFISHELVNIQDILTTYGVYAKSVPLKTAAGKKYAEIVGKLLGEADPGTIGRYLGDALQHLHAIDVGLAKNTYGALTRGYFWMQNMVRQSVLGLNPRVWVSNFLDNNNKAMMAGFMPSGYDTSAYGKVTAYFADNFQMVMPENTAASIMLESALHMTDDTMAFDVLPWPLGPKMPFPMDKDQMSEFFSVMTGRKWNPSFSFMDGGSNLSNWVAKWNLANAQRVGLKFYSNLERMGRVTVFQQQFDIEITQARTKVLKIMESDPSTFTPELIQGLADGTIKGPHNIEEIFKVKYEDALAKQIPKKDLNSLIPKSAPDFAFFDEMRGLISRVQANRLTNIISQRQMGFKLTDMFEKGRVSAYDIFKDTVDSTIDMTKQPQEVLQELEKKADEFLQRETKPLTDVAPTGVKDQEMFLQDTLMEINRNAADLGLSPIDEQGFSSLFDPEYTQSQLVSARDLGAMPSNPVLGMLFQDIDDAALITNFADYLLTQDLEQVYMMAMKLHNEFRAGLGQPPINYARFLPGAEIEVAETGAKTFDLTPNISLEIPDLTSGEVSAWNADQYKSLGNNPGTRIAIVYDQATGRWAWTDDIHDVALKKLYPGDYKNIAENITGGVLGPEGGSPTIVNMVLNRGDDIVITINSDVLGGINSEIADALIASGFPESLIMKMDAFNPTDEGNLLGTLGELTTQGLPSGVQLDQISEEGMVDVYTYLDEAGNVVDEINKIFLGDEVASSNAGLRGTYTVENGWEFTMVQHKPGVDGAPVQLITLSKQSVKGTLSISIKTAVGDRAMAVEISRAYKALNELGVSLNTVLVGDEAGKLLGQVIKEGLDHLIIPKGLSLEDVLLINDFSINVSLARQRLFKGLIDTSIKSTDIMLGIFTPGNRLIWSLAPPDSDHGKMLKYADAERFGSVLTTVLKQNGLMVVGTPSEALLFQWAKEMIKWGADPELRLKVTMGTDKVWDGNLGLLENPEDYPLERVHTTVAQSIEHDLPQADHRQTILTKASEDFSLVLQTLNEWEKAIEATLVDDFKGFTRTQEEVKKAREIFDDFKSLWIEELDEAFVKAETKVNEVFFDYTYRNNIEQLVRHYGPFTTWQLRNPAFWAQALGNKPGFITAAYHYYQQTEQERKKRGLTQRFRNTLLFDTPEGGVVGVDPTAFFSIFSQLDAPFEPPGDFEPSNAFLKFLQIATQTGQTLGITPWPWLSAGLERIGAIAPGSTSLSFGPQQRLLEMAMRAAGVLDVDEGLFGTNLTSEFLNDYYVARRIVEMQAEGLITEQEAILALGDENNEIFIQAQDYVKRLGFITGGLSLVSPFGLKIASPGEVEIREALLDRPPSEEFQARVQYDSVHPYIRTYGLIFQEEVNIQVAQVYAKYEPLMEGFMPWDPEYKTLAGLRAIEVEALLGNPTSPEDLMVEYLSTPIETFDDEEPTLEQLTVGTFYRMSTLEPRAALFVDPETGEVDWDLYEKALEDFMSSIPEISAQIGVAIELDEYLAWKFRFSTPEQVAYGLYKDSIGDAWDEFYGIQPGGDQFTNSLNWALTYQMMKDLAAGFTWSEAEQLRAQNALNWERDGLPYTITQILVGHLTSPINLKTFAGQVAEILGIDLTDAAKKLELTGALDVQLPGLFGSEDLAQQAKSYLFDYYYNITPPEQRELRDFLGLEDGTFLENMTNGQIIRLAQKVRAEFNKLSELAGGLLVGEAPGYIPVIPPLNPLTDLEKADLEKLRVDWFRYNASREEGLTGMWTPLMEQYYGDPDSASSRFWAALSAVALSDDAFTDPFLSPILNSASRALFDFTDEQYEAALKHFLDNRQFLVDEEMTLLMLENPDWVVAAQQQRIEFGALRNIDMEILKGEYYSVGFDDRAAWQTANPEEWAQLEIYLLTERARVVAFPLYMYFFRSSEYDKWFGNKSPDMVDLEVAQQVSADFSLAIQQLMDYRAGEGEWTNLMRRFIGPSPSDWAWINEQAWAFFADPSELIKLLKIYYNMSTADRSAWRNANPIQYLAFTFYWALDQAGRSKYWTSSGR